MRLIAQHFVHIFAERFIILFYGHEQIESIERDTQLQALERKTHGYIPQSVAAGGEGYGARAEIGDLYCGSIHAESAYRGEHVVYKRLIYYNVQTVVIFPFRDVHPIGSVLYFQNLEDGDKQVCQILADVHIAVLRHRKSHNRAVRLGQVCFARYLSVVRAEEFVEEVNGDFLNVFDEFGQRERNGKALSVPHGRRACQSFDYLTYVYI